MIGMARFRFVGQLAAVFFVNSRRCKTFVNHRYHNRAAQWFITPAKQTISITGIAESVVAHLYIIKIEGYPQVIDKKSGVLNLFADLIQVNRHILFKGDHKNIAVKVGFDIADEIEGAQRFFCRFGTHGAGEPAYL